MNLIQDIPRLNESLAHLGLETNFSRFVRLVLRDLHAKQEKKLQIAWPPSLETVKAKPKNKRHKTGAP